MGTAIYTKEVIWAAADELEAEKEKATHANIRKKLAGGSFTTISEAMNERRVKLAAAQAPRRDPAPERVTQAAQEFASTVWDTAQDVMSARLAAERESLEAARQEFLSDQKQAAEFADQLSAENETANSKIEELTAALEKSVTERAEAVTRAERAEATATERQTHIVSIKDDLHHQQQEHIVEIKRITIERDENRSRADRAEATAENVMKQHSALIASINTPAAATAETSPKAPTSARKKPQP